MSAPRNFTERVRDAEFARVRGEFKAADRVLEIGGGSGFMKNRIAGCVDVCVSVDVAPHTDPVEDVLI